MVHFPPPVQLNKTKYLLLVTLDQLYRLLSNTNHTAHKTIMFLHHTNRCGSTHVSAVFKRYPDKRDLSEPESFYSAYYLYHVHQTVTKEQYHTMVQAAVIMLCLTPYRREFFQS